MKNYVVAFGALVLVVSICVLVIHFEAEQTRESMRQMARDELPELLQDGVTDSLVNSGGKLPRPGRSIPEGGGTDPPSKDSGADGPLGKVLDSLPTKPTRPADVIDDLFGTARDVINSSEAGLKPYVELSISEERSIGRKYHQEMMREHDVVKDTALYDRIDEAAAPLLRARRRRGIDYTFTVIKTDPENLNAFSIVGGYIYIHSAIIDFVKTDAELQCLLGHEIGHVDLGHCSHRTGMNDILSDYGGNLAANLHAMLTMPFSQEQEFQADEYGFRAMIAAGRTRDEALELARHFAKHFRLRGENQPWKKKSDHSIIGTLREDINSHFLSHPYDDDRVKRLESIDVNSPSPF